MQSDLQRPPASKGMLWTGWIVSAAPSLFLLVDGAMKLAKPPIVVQTTVQLGYPESVILGLGMILLACTVLYLVPRTSVLGAILLTAYLGGAVATQVRVGGGLFSGLLPSHYGHVALGRACPARSPAAGPYPTADSVTRPTTPATGRQQEPPDKSKQMPVSGFHKLR